MGSAWIDRAREGAEWVKAAASVYGARTGGHDFSRAV